MACNRYKATLREAFYNNNEIDAFIYLHDEVNKKAVTFSLKPVNSSVEFSFHTTRESMWEMIGAFAEALGGSVYHPDEDKDSEV